MIVTRIHAKKNTSIDNSIYIQFLHIPIDWNTVSFPMATTFYCACVAKFRKSVTISPLIHQWLSMWRNVSLPCSDFSKMFINFRSSIPVKFWYNLNFSGIADGDPAAILRTIQSSILADMCCKLRQAVIFIWQQRNHGQVFTIMKETIRVDTKSRFV